MTTKILVSSNGIHALLVFVVFLGVSCGRIQALQDESTNRETSLQSHVCSNVRSYSGDINALDGSSSCGTLYNELDCISALGIYQGFCSWDSHRCFSGVDGEKTDCDTITEDLCSISNFSVLRPCKWVVREPKVPTSTPVTADGKGSSELIAVPTEALPQTGGPTTVDFGHQFDPDMFSTPTALWGMDQYSSTNSGKRMSLRMEQSLSSPIDLAPSSLHWNDDWRPAHEMEKTNEELIDTPTNEEATYSNTPTLEPSNSMSRDTMPQLARNSGAGSASPFLGWALIIVGFVVAEVLFGCCSYRSWRREANETKPAQLDLTILCDDTDNTKAAPINPVILFDDMPVSQHDPTNPSEANCTTP
ncbi:hypothetical protein MHU86_6586 [Fragilaria crotonensis]|nr:hypothetical protein MHU86_6586 [Fragilaria crotonensis]